MLSRTHLLLMYQWFVCEKYHTYNNTKVDLGMRKQLYSFCVIITHTVRRKILLSNCRLIFTRFEHKMNTFLSAFYYINETFSLLMHIKNKFLL